MEEGEQSYYSNDEQYFLDVCRAGEPQELKQFVQGFSQANPFDWTCLSNTHDNFLHMLAANNRALIFDYLFPIVAKQIGPERTSLLVNKQNSSGNTPLHYAVITDSKDMVNRLVKSGANTNLTNDSGRTPFTEAEEFDKIEIAEILAPITYNNLEELKKGMELLEVCNEGDSDEDQQEQQQKKELPKQQRKYQEVAKEAQVPQQNLDKKEDK